MDTQDPLNEEEILKLHQLRTQIEYVRGAKYNKVNESTAYPTPEITLQDSDEDSGSDFQFEKDDFNSSDSEFDAREKTNLCKKRDIFNRKQDQSHLTSTDSEDEVPLAVIRHKKLQPKTKSKTKDEGSSTSTGACICDLLVDNNNEAVIVGNAELTWGEQIKTAKKMPPKRVNKAKKRKCLFNLGEEYINKKGKTVAAKSLGIGCDQNTCKRRCKDKVSQQQRLTILQAHWRLGHPRMRWDYIAKTVKINMPKFRRTGTSRPKETSRVYTFTINDKEVTVCKKFYLHTLSIAETVVTTALNKKAEGGIVQPDERGSHSNRPQDLGDEKDEIRRHIESFPVIDSHYCRKSTSRQYLSPTLSIEHMHRLYVDKRRKEGALRSAKLSSYKNVFHNEYNLGFFRPKKDICSTCSTFEKSDDKSEDIKLNQEKRREEIYAFASTEKTQKSEWKRIRRWQLQPLI